MKLVDRTAPQQRDDDSRGLAGGPVRLGGFRYPRFRMAAAQVKPLLLVVDRRTIETERLIDEHEPVGVSMRECESILVPSGIGPHGHRRVHPPGDIIAPKELVVGSTLQRDELLQSARLQHPAHHLEEADQIRLARPVGTDQNGYGGQIPDLYVRKGPES